MMYAYRLPFFKLLRAFFSLPSPAAASPAALSALRFCPAAAFSPVVFTLTSVDLPPPPAPAPAASFATCASAALQSADPSVIAYLSGRGTGQRRRLCERETRRAKTRKDREEER